jgi:hypothetical protein
MRRRTWLIAAALTLGASAPAQAAAPVDLGVGVNPSVVVDPAGTAHVVYATADGAQYCRLPRNTNGCDVLTPLPLDQRDDAVRIFRRAADGALLIIQGSTQDSADDTVHGLTFLRISGDDGATWSGPAAIGGGVTHLTGAALAADGQSLLTLTDETGPVWLQDDPFTALNTASLDVNASPAGGEASTSGGGDVIQTPQGRVISVVDADEENTTWRSFAGGNIYDQAAWQPFPGGKVRGEANPRLATGKRGTYLLNWRSIAFQRRDRQAPFVIRSFDSKKLRWRAGVSAAADRAVTGDFAFKEDDGGHLQLGWVDSEAGKNCVVYARTGPKSRQWFGPSTTLFKAPDGPSAPVGLDIAANASGRGVAVWDQGRPGGTDYGHVVATPLKQRAGRYRAIRNPYDRADC